MSVVNIVAAWMACLAVAAPKYRCSALVESVRQELRTAEQHPVPLATPAVRVAGGEGAGEPCEGFPQATRALGSGGGAERGTLGGHRAAVVIDGPHGSGHFSDVTVAVALDGRVVGACFTTSTSGWRNLSGDGHRRFGRWQPLTGGRLRVWSGLAAGAAEYESLIFALVYRLRGDALLLDRAATLDEIARMGRAYAAPDAAPAGDDEAAALHRAAAAAYHALATGTGCP